MHGAVYGAVLEAEAEPVAGGELGGMLMDKEDGFVSVPGGTAVGEWDVEVRWFGGRGVESPGDYVG